MANQLGFVHAMVVHGVDGLDEISLLGETKVAEIKDGNIRYYSIYPEKFGMRRCTFEDVKGGNPGYNAQLIRNIFTGKERGSKRDMLLLNAAAAFLVADKVNSMEEGLAMAKDVIDSGRALAKLEEIVRKSSGLTRN